MNLVSEINKKYGRPILDSSPSCVPKIPNYGNSSFENKGMEDIKLSYIIKS